MNIRSFVFGTLAALGLAAAAQADTVTFDFTAANSGSWQPSLSYVKSVFSVEDLALTVTGDPSGSNVRTWAGYGLGVCNPGEQPSCSNGPHQVDSSGADEVVRLAFNQAVTLTQIVFNFVNSDDTFNLLTSAGLQISAGALPNTSTATVNLIDVYTDLVFGIGAGSTTTEHCAKEHRGQCVKWKSVTYDSAFKIASVTVDLQPPATVPLPATGLLLVGGLGLLAAARRRRAAA